MSADDIRSEHHGVIPLPHGRDVPDGLSLLIIAQSGNTAKKQK